LLEQAQAGEVPPLSPYGYPDEERLYGIVMRALSHDPDGRHQTALEMERELEDYLSENRLVASPMRFSDWLLEHFEQTIVEHRKARELASKRLEEEPVESHPRRRRESSGAPTAPEALAPGRARVVPVSSRPSHVPAQSAVPVVWLLVAAVLGGLLAFLVFR
jgi:serine/threonine-protein kinase